MLSLASKQAASIVRSLLSSSALAVALAASGGGCTLLVGDQLSDKPSEGSGGQGGEGGAPSSVSASQSSTGTGGLVCGPDKANCDGSWMNGCEANLKSDQKNCGACKNECKDGKHCKESKCQ